MLNGYSQQIDGTVTDEGMRKVEDGSWQASLVLSWCGGAPVRAIGRAAGKKAAIHSAAFNILNQIT